MNWNDSMKLDEVDFRILEILQKDARKSLREIAKEVGTSTPTVSSKLSALEDLGLVKGYGANIDAEKLGETSIVLLIKSKPSDIDKIANSLVKNDNVREFILLSGSMVQVKATFLHADEINGFLSDLGSIPEIQHYDYHTILSAVKEEQRALVSGDPSKVIECYYCKKPIHDKPVKLKLDGKDHYLCCNTCKREYVKKYEALKSKA